MTRSAYALLVGALCAAPASASSVEITVRGDGMKLMKNEPGESRVRRLAMRLLPVPDSKFSELIDRFAAERGLDPLLVQALMQVESGYNPNALSQKGAMGLMQLMPDTARELSVEDPWDPEQNVRGGTAYLKRQLDRFGNIEWALAAYNAGPEAVNRHGGIPPFDETRAYVRKIFCLLEGGCEGDEPESSGRPVKIVRDANNRIVLTTSGGGG